MTRKDYDLLQTALGDALFRVRKMKNERPSTPEEAFWITAETVADYLKSANKTFDQNYYKQAILGTSAIGAGIDAIEPKPKERRRK